jgi:transcriptional regulator GlxA family with amidase domain
MPVWGTLVSGSELVANSWQESIALEVLARITQLSVHHFARAFRQSLGMPPHNYIVQRRLEHAQQLLRNTDLSLSEIAVEAAFTDQRHLARYFRTIVGVSPGLARHRFRTAADILLNRPAQAGS